MVKIMDVRNSKERDGFWEAYPGCAEENRVGTDRSPFYVKWSKDFAHFLPEKPLKDRSRKDIEPFLADLGKRRGIADWQVWQAEDALKILYEIFLPRYTPERQAAVGPTGKHPAQKAIARAYGFRDRVTMLPERFSGLRDCLTSGGGGTKTASERGAPAGPIQSGLEMGKEGCQNILRKSFRRTMDMF